MLITSFGKNCMNPRNTYHVRTAFINPDQEVGNPNATKFDPDALYALRKLLENYSTFFVMNSNALMVVITPEKRPDWELVSRSIPILANCNIKCPLSIQIEYVDVVMKTTKQYTYNSCFVQKTIITEDQVSISFNGTCEITENPLATEDTSEETSDETGFCCSDGVCNIPGLEDDPE